MKYTPMNSKHLGRLVTSSILLTAIAACGGVGSDLLESPAAAIPDTGNTAENVTNTNGSIETDAEGENVTTPTYLPEASTTSELQSTVQFDFTTRWEMHVDFDVAQAKEQAGFLSICTDYEFDGESAYQVDFDSCSLRAAINEGSYQGYVNITNDIDSLLAVIWFANESNPPLYQEFAIGTAQPTIVWR